MNQIKKIIVMSNAHIIIILMNLISIDALIMKHAQKNIINGLKEKINV